MEKTRRVAIWGAGGHAKVVADTVRRQGAWAIEGFIDDIARGRDGEPFAGGRILGGREVLPDLLAAGVCDMILAFGHCGARLSVWKEMKALGFMFPPVLDPTAIVSGSAIVGEGCFVGAAAVVNADARLGAQVIVNTGSIVEHDCIVHDGVHLAPRTCLAGHVSVGQAAFVGAGAVVRDRLCIGAGSVVGLGAVVVHDVPDRSVVYGCPARVSGVAKE